MAAEPEKRNYQTLDYQVETHQQGKQEPIVVLKNAPDGQGEKLGQNQTNTDGAVFQEVKRLNEQGIAPDRAQIFQERQDGDFEKVSFKEQNNEQGELYYAEQREIVSQRAMEATLEVGQTPDQIQNKLQEQGTLTEGVPDIAKEVAKQQEDQQGISRGQEIKPHNIQP